VRVPTERYNKVIDYQLNKMILHFVLQLDQRRPARRLGLNGQRNGNGAQKACA